MQIIAEVAGAVRLRSRAATGGRTIIRAPAPRRLVPAGLAGAILVIGLVVATGLQAPAGSSGPTATGASGHSTTARPSTSLGHDEARAVPAAGGIGGTELYGYLPYWQMTTSMADYLQDVSLTSLELFSVAANKSGTINHGQIGYKRITGAIGARLIAEAHARGQRVELVFTSFGFDRNAALFGVSTLPTFDPRIREPLDTIPAPGTAPPAVRTAQGLATLVSRLGLDGVNIDVEQISPGSYEGFSAFVSQLRARLDRIDPRLRLSAATMANRSGANLAGVALDAGADHVFMMGYDFHWSGSDPGGSTPVERLDGGASLTTAMATYAAAGVPVDRILLGLPLYGMAWPVAAPDRYASRTGPGRAWLPSKHVAQLTAPGFAPHTDPLEVSEYLSEVVAPPATDPLGGVTWRAIFYDSPNTLRTKLAIARGAGYAGGGFWALGYEKGVPGYIDLMADFVGGRVAPASASPTGPVQPPPCVGRC